MKKSTKDRAALVAAFKLWLRDNMACLEGRRFCHGLTAEEAYTKVLVQEVQRRSWVAWFRKKLDIRGRLCDWFIHGLTNSQYSKRFAFPRRAAKKAGLA